MHAEIDHGAIVAQKIEVMYRVYMRICTNSRSAVVMKQNEYTAEQIKKAVHIWVLE
jgi:hypothetical protein